MATYGPYELCDWLRAEILAALDSCGRDPVTTSYPGVGLIAWDDCCGQLVVTPERIYRTQQFPLEDTTDERCSQGTIAVDLLAVLVRCVPTPDAAGNAPSAAELAAAHKAVLDDAAVCWSAMSGPLDPDLEWERASLSQQFVGAEGGCIAIESRVTIGVEAAYWCVDC